MKLWIAATTALVALVVSVTTAPFGGAEIIQEDSLRIVADSTDESAALNLENATPQPDAYKPFLPAISFWANGVRRWSTGFDVGPNYDFVPLYRRDPDNAADSVDVMYVTNEKWPKVGVLRNTPDAQLHVESKVSVRPSLIAESALPSGWNTVWRLAGNGTAGVWHDGSMSLGSVASPPRERLVVYGTAAANGFRTIGEAMGPVLGLTDPLMYGTGSNPNAAYPFNAYGHLVLQPRDHPFRDVVVMTGSPPRPVLSVKADGSLRLEDKDGVGGGSLFVEDGALKFRGGNGTVTVVAPA